MPTYKCPVSKCDYTAPQAGNCLTHPTQKLKPATIWVARIAGALVSRTVGGKSAATGTTATTTQPTGANPPTPPNGTQPPGWQAGRQTGTPAPGAPAKPAFTTSREAENNRKVAQLAQLKVKINEALVHLPPSFQQTARQGEIDSQGKSAEDQLIDTGRMLLQLRRELRVVADQRKAEIDSLVGSLPPEVGNPLASRATTLLAADPLDMVALGEVKIAAQVATFNAAAGTPPLTDPERQALAGAIRQRPGLADGLRQTYTDHQAKLTTARAGLAGSEDKLDAQTKRLLDADSVSPQEHQAAADRLVALDATVEDRHAAREQSIKAANDSLALYRSGGMTREAYTASRPTLLANYEAADRALVTAKADAAAQRKAMPVLAVKMTRGQLVAELEGGPLSKPVGANSKFDAAAADLLKSFGKHPEATSYALGLAQHVEHPETLAKGVQVLGPLQDKNFALANGDFFGAPASQKMARNALAMGGAMGGTYFDELDAYYGANKHATVRFATRNAEERGMKFASGFGQALVSNGQVDFGTAPVKEMYDDLRFSYDTLQSPMPEMVKNLDALQAKFTGPQGGSYRSRITAMKAPRASAGRGVVRKTLGLGDTAAVSADDTRAAVLSAMITPLRQGAVGSCFATGPCIKYQREKPLEVMDQLSHIAQRGTYRPPSGRMPSIPVVKNIAANQNPLLRGWEYTVATASAKQTNSEEQKILGFSLLGEYNTQVGQPSLKDLIPSNVRDAKTAEIKAKLATAFTFVYNPEVEISDSTDGSSSKGAFQMQHTDPTGGTAHTLVTEQSFKDSAKEIFKQALGADPTLSGQIDAFVDSDAFTQGLKKGFPSGGTPWQLGGGGYESSPAQLLNGRPFTAQTVTGGSAAGTATGAVILEGLLGVGGGPGTKTLGIPGHAVTGLLDHPSLSPLLAGGSGAVSTNVQTQLVDKSTALAGEDVPTARAAYLQNKAIENFVTNYFDDPIAAGSFMKSQLPTTPMKPAALKTWIVDKAKAAKKQQDIKALRKDHPTETDTQLETRYTTAKATKETADLAKLRTDHPTETDAEIRTRLREDDPFQSVHRGLNVRLDSLLINELGFPTFTVADMNWGDQAHQTHMVATADPGTGQPTLYMRNTFTGELSSPGESFRQGKWTALV